MLYRSLFVLGIAACGGADTRPLTLEYVTLTVLAPACGTVACHSTTSNVHGYAFDTVEASRRSLMGLVVRGDPAASKLIQSIRSPGRRPMPPDAPMSELDIELLEDWIANDAEGL